MGREKLAERLARVHLSRQIKKEKKERREVVLQVRPGGPGGAVVVYILLLPLNVNIDPPL